MRGLVLGLAVLVLSMATASAQEAVYPRYGYAPFGYHYSQGYGHYGYHHRYYAYYPRYRHRRHWYHY